MEEKIIGNFIANEKGFGFVEVNNETEDIFISIDNIKDAIDGDTVVVEVTEVKEEQSEKAEEPMLVTLLGIVTEVTEEQPLKA